MYLGDLQRQGVEHALQDVLEIPVVIAGLIDESTNGIELLKQLVR
jgi:hypothetical protein